MEFACLLIRGASRTAENSKYPTLLCAPAGRTFAGVRGALLYPGFRHVRIKRLSILSPQQVLVAVKGAAKSSLIPGSILVEEAAPIYRSRTAYAISSRHIEAGVYRLTGGLFREHRLPGSVTVEPRAGGYRLSASADLPLLPGARYRLLAVEREGEPSTEARPAGPPPEIRICLPDELPPRRREELPALLRRLSEGFDRELLFHELVRIYGWAALPAVLASGFPEQAKGEGGEQLATLLGRRGVSYSLRRTRLEELAQEVRRRVRGAPGTTVRRLAGELALPEDLVDAIASGLVSGGSIELRGGMLVGRGGEVSLPPLERGLETMLKDSSGERVFFRARNPRERKMLEKLARLNLAVRIGEFFCHRVRYDEMVRAILAGGHPGDRVAVENARQRSGAPRELLPELLARMEAEGILRREGKVCRIAHGQGAISG